jgi:phosphoribosylanthranilate isomerase
MEMLVKICCMTDIEDIKSAIEFGADFIGILVDVDYSPRSLSLAEAERLMLYPQRTVMLVYKKSLKELIKLAKTLKPHAVQILSEEKYEYVKAITMETKVQVWKSIFVPEKTDIHIINSLYEKSVQFIKHGVSAIVLDAVGKEEGKVRYGGTGRTFDWNSAVQLFSMLRKQKVLKFIAGGINEENVISAIKIIQPDGIDVCSGVEAFPRKKNREKMKRLIKLAKTLSRP